MKIHGSYTAFKAFLSDSARTADPILFTVAIEPPHVVEHLASYDNSTGAWVVWAVMGEISERQLISDYPKAIRVARETQF